MERSHRQIVLERDFQTIRGLARHFDQEKSLRDRPACPSRRSTCRCGSRGPTAAFTREPALTARCRLPAEAVRPDAGQRSIRRGTRTAASGTGSRCGVIDSVLDDTGCEPDPTLRLRAFAGTPLVRTTGPRPPGLPVVVTDGTGTRRTRLEQPFCHPDSVRSAHAGPTRAVRSPVAMPTAALRPHAQCEAQCPQHCDVTRSWPRSLAEGVGFEPTVSCPTHAFQACRFGRSRIPPERGDGTAR